MTDDDEIVDSLRRQWGLAPKATTVSVTLRQWTEVLTFAAYCRGMAMAAAAAVTAGVGRNFGTWLEAEVDGLNRRQATVTAGI